MERDHFSIDQPQGRSTDSRGDEAAEAPAPAPEWRRRAASTPPLQQVRTGKLSQQVVDQFKALLASGEIRPNDRLPPERELAEMFGVGRNSVREALRELEILGLIERRRGRGTHVRQVDTAVTLAPIRSVLSLSETLVDEVLEFRRSFEPQVAALAAQKVTDQSASMLKRAFQDYDRAHGPARSPRAGVALKADTNFHRSIAVASANPIMIALHDALDELLVDFRSHLAPDNPQQAKRVSQGHARILDAILAGDESAARTAMIEHLDELHSVIEQTDTTADRADGRQEERVERSPQAQ